MSDKVGPIAIKKVNNPFLGGVANSIDTSPELLREIDDEVKRILTEAYEQAKATIEAHKEPLKAVVKKLLEKESITCEEFVEILKLYGVEVKTGCKKDEAKTFEDTKSPEEKKEKEVV